MKKTEITCDSCERKIERQIGYSTHFLSLSNMYMSPGGGVSYDVMELPILDDDLYFCGIGCLKNWINKNITKGSLCVDL